MAVIEAQTIPKRKITTDDVLSRFCYHFQQYTYVEAKRLPYKRIKAMLKTADQENAKRLLIQVHAMAAPHSKGGKEYQKLVKFLQNIAEG